MLTDTEARDFLHRAAATIDVAPSGPLAVPPHRPWWPALAAAAAVFVATGLTVELRGNGPSTTPEPPAATQATVEAPQGPLPSVFGYAADDAALMLREIGYVVDVQVVPTCETAGRSVGVRQDAGNRVTVLEADGGISMDCLHPVDDDRADAWELLDLVNGRDSDLDLAPTIRAFVGRTPTHLRADELASWPPLVDLVTERSRPVTNLDDGTQTDPSLLTRRSGDPGCGGPRPRELQGRPGLVISIGVLTDGEPLECRAAVLYYDGGKVVAVQVVHALF